MWKGFYFGVGHITSVNPNVLEDGTSSMWTPWASGLSHKGNDLFKGDMEQGLTHFSCKEPGSK